MKSENFPYLITEGLRTVFADAFKEIPSKKNLLYSVSKSNKAVEYDYSMGDIGSIGEFSGKVAYDKIYGQYRTSYEHTEYAGGIQITRKLMADDLYNVIKKSPRALGMAMRRRREDDAASPFINAFNASVTYGDGKVLCASDHPAEGISTTFSNVTTSSNSLTAANLSASRLAMKKIASSSNQKIYINPDMILVPIDLEEQASIILKTTLKVDSANNDINFNNLRYKPIVWDNLTSTSDWFMIDSMLMKQFLNWFDREPVEFNEDSDSDTMIRKYFTYARYSAGASEWRWIRGHDVA